MFAGFLMKKFAGAAYLLLAALLAAEESAGADQQTTKVFNAAAVNPDAPPYQPELWNDGSSLKLDKFYQDHQEELGKIYPHTGRLFMWRLARVLYQTSDKQLQELYGLTVEEALSFRQG